jgi:hypothetical protein
MGIKGKPPTKGKLVQPKNVPKKKGTALARSGRGGSRVDQDALRYNGPVILRGMSQALTDLVITLNYTTTLVSTAGGVISTVFDTDPTLAPEFSDYSSLWKEYRCLATEIEFSPDLQYQSVSPGKTIGCALQRVDGFVAFTTWAGVVADPSFRFLSLQVPWNDGKFYTGTRCVPPKWEMNGTEEAGFIHCSTPGPTGAICLFGDGMGNAITYGRIVQRWLLQFRSPY